MQRRIPAMVQSGGNTETATTKGNSSEIKVTIDFHSNFVHCIFIIRELQF